MFGLVGVAGRGEGSCAGAIGVVAGLSGQKINAPMNKNGLLPSKKHIPQEQGFGRLGPKSILLLGRVYGNLKNESISVGGTSGKGNGGLRPSRRHCATDHFHTVKQHKISRSVECRRN